MNPFKGLDMVATNIVKDVTVKDGVVRLAINMREDYQFSAAIKEEVREKIEPLRDVDEVLISFND